MLQRAPSRSRLIAYVYMVVSAAACGLAVPAGMAKLGNKFDAGVLAAALAVPAFKFRRATLIAGLLTLSVAPEYVFPSHAAIGGQAGRVVLYATLLPLILERGIARRGLLTPIAAYAALYVISKLGGTPAPALTDKQSLSSFVALSYVWLLLSVRYTKQDVVRLLGLLTVLPLVSVTLGALLDLAGLYPLLASGPTRLQGAEIAAYLGPVSASAVLAAVLLRRAVSIGMVEAGELGRHLNSGRLLTLALLDTAILCGTLARGAAIVLVIGMIPVGLRALREATSRAGTKPLRLIVGGLGLSVIALVAVPAFLARDHQTTYVPGVGQVADASSGRLAAWSEFFQYAKVNLAFGRGLGSGPVLAVSASGFKAQHNEYLRLLLEGGFVGGSLVALAIAYVLVVLVRRTAPELRAEVAAAAMAFAVFSFVDNTLSAASVGVPMLLMIGAASLLPTQTQPPPAAQALLTWAQPG